VAHLPWRGAPGNLAAATLISLAYRQHHGSRWLPCSVSGFIPRGGCVPAATRSTLPGCRAWLTLRDVGGIMTTPADPFAVVRTKKYHHAVPRQRRHQGDAASNRRGRGGVRGNKSGSPGRRPHRRSPSQARRPSPRKSANPQGSRIPAWLSSGDGPFRSSPCSLNQKPRAAER